MVSYFPSNRCNISTQHACKNLDNHPFVPHPKKFNNNNNNEHVIEIDLFV